MKVCFYAIMVYMQNAGRPHAKTRRYLTITPTDSRIQALARWIDKEQGRAIIRLNGKKTAVVLTYAEYEAIEALRTQHMKEELLQKLERVGKRHLRTTCNRPNR